MTVSFDSRSDNDSKIVAELSLIAASQTASATESFMMITVVDEDGGTGCTKASAMSPAMTNTTAEVNRSAKAAPTA